MHLITDLETIEMSKAGLLPDPEYPYIATPFTYKGIGAERKMMERYQMAVLISSVLFKMGRPHYSPIVATYPPSKILKNPADSDFWLKLDATSIKRSDALWVIMMPEWASSKGIRREVDMFSDLLTHTEYGLDDENPKYKIPIRFYPLQSFLDGDLHNFQILNLHKPIIKDIKLRAG